MWNALKRICEHKEKQVYCFHCSMYTGEVHFCTREKQWIHMDRYNRLIIYSSTELGATPKNNNDVSDVLYTIELGKFEIDNRTGIRDDRRETQEKAGTLWQLMNIFLYKNVELTKDLNKNLDESRFSKNWSNVKKCLGYHPETP